MMATSSLVLPSMVDAGETRMALGNYRAPIQRLGADHRRRAAKRRICSASLQHGIRRQGIQPHPNNQLMKEVQQTLSCCWRTLAQRIRPCQKRHRGMPGETLPAANLLGVPQTINNTCRNISAIFHTNLLAKRRNGTRMQSQLPPRQRIQHWGIRRGGSLSCHPLPSMR